MADADELPAAVRSPPVTDAHLLARWHGAVALRVPPTRGGGLCPRAAMDAIEVFTTLGSVVLGVRAVQTAAPRGPLSNHSVIQNLSSAAPYGAPANDRGSTTRARILHHWHRCSRPHCSRPATAARRRPTARGAAAVIGPPRRRPTGPSTRSRPTSSRATGRGLHRARPRLDQGRRARRASRERDLGDDRRRRHPEFADRKTTQAWTARHHGLVHRGLHAGRAQDAAREGAPPALRPANTVFDGLRGPDAAGGHRPRQARGPSASTPRPSTRPTSTRSGSLEEPL